MGIGAAYWTMPVRSPVERAARQRAKEVYEARHPLTPHKGGRFVSQSGHVHYYGGAAGRKVAEALAEADLPPVPNTLVPGYIDDRLVWLGQHGTYPIDLANIADSVQQALQQEGQPAAEV